MTFAKNDLIAALPMKAVKTDKYVYVQRTALPPVKFIDPPMEINMKIQVISTRNRDMAEAGSSLVIIDNGYQIAQLTFTQVTIPAGSDRAAQEHSLAQKIARAFNNMPEQGDAI